MQLNSPTHFAVDLQQVMDCGLICELMQERRQRIDRTVCNHKGTARAAGGGLWAAQQHHTHITSVGSAQLQEMLRTEIDTFQLGMPFNCAFISFCSTHIKQSK
jgi:hypothetical protein